MGLDFNKLSENADFKVDKPLTNGKPLEVPLSDIAQNPDNPRKEFDTKHLTDLAADIKQNNVKSPVSIRKNLTGETTWTLNYGACRYRASQLAGKDTIPAFVDEQFTDYDAIAENEQRQSLTAMELAMFIQKRKDLGESNVEIAAQLKTNKQSITHHLALINMPEAIAEAYRSGRLKVVRAIYDLITLNKKHAKEVTDFCNDTDEIRHSDVKKLSAILKPSKLPECDPNKKAELKPIQAPTAAPKPTETSKPDVTKFANIPALLIDVKGEQAVIVLERKPTTRGMIWVKYLSNNKTTEVTTESCTLLELTSVEKLHEPNRETV